MRRVPGSASLTLLRTAALSPPRHRPVACGPTTLTARPLGGLRCADEALGLARKLCCAREPSQPEGGSCVARESRYNINLSLTDSRCLPSISGASILRSQDPLAACRRLTDRNKKFRGCCATWRRRATSKSQPGKARYNVARRTSGSGKSDRLPERAPAVRDRARSRDGLASAYARWRWGAETRMRAIAACLPRRDDPLGCRNARTRLGTCNGGCMIPGAPPQPAAKRPAQEMRDAADR